MKISALRHHQCPQRSPAVRQNRRGAATHPPPLVHFQHAIGNQTVLRLLRTNSPKRSLKLYDDKPKAETKKPEPQKPPSREACDNKCGTSGGPFGNTECEIDLKSGLLTGKVTKEIFDKNPCTAPCVAVHEGVHAKKIAPICAASKKCLDAAGKDTKKQDTCLDKHDAAMNAVVFSTECAAYTAETECLTKRAQKTECKTTDGKKRLEEQVKMVNCYKACFCKG